MIAGCTDRIGTDSCGSCVRGDACSPLFAGLFGTGPSGRCATPRRSGPKGSPLRNVFLAMLAEAAKSIERSARARRAAGEPRVPPRAFMKSPAPTAASEVRSASVRFSEVVERHLEPLLASGPTAIDTVARALGYSRQTLYRRLKAEGVTYAQVLDALRRKLALRLIREEGQSVKEAAWRLGFSDPAAFSRAFKRWMGVSPRSMRPPRRGGGGQSG